VIAAAVTAAIVAAVLVLVLTRSQKTVAPAANTAPSPTVTRTAAPPQQTVTQQPPSTPPPATVTQAPPRTIAIPPPSGSGDVGTPDHYVNDIWAAGITAPADWVDSTGQGLCSAWEAGDTTAYTDQQLLAGGIYSSHLGTFDSITANDLCPGTPGGP
jgi:hypothetical protein